MLILPKSLTLRIKIPDIMRLNYFKSTLLLAFMSLAVNAFAWGQKGHDTVAEIASRHLTPATQAAVDSILDGRTMVYWANWLDNASHTPEYAYTKTWHYKNVDADKTYLTMPKNPDGDVVTGIRYCIKVLNDPAQTAENRNLCLKILIHLVGDLHQPMHMGHLSDLGGNRVKVRFFGRDANLHGIWDSNILESAHKWSYTEWADQLDRLNPSQAALLASGNIDDWAHRTLDSAAAIYDATPEGTNLSYNEVARWAPLIENSLLAGGLRLARILNALFDPATSSIPATSF